MKQEPPIALAAYESLAEQYAARVDTKPHNALYERPATISLLPPVEGKRVLDAGCGPGAYSEWLLEHGAEVVGLDVSPSMIHFARQRLGEGVVLHQADLNAPLDFLPSASFDIVLSPLTLDYVRDWEQVFAEFHRLLRMPGTLVFSCGHPFADSQIPGSKDYHVIEMLEYEWHGFGFPVVVPFYRRPLGAMLDALLGAGFTLERLLEPKPLKSFRQHEPVEYEKLCHNPGFLCIRAAKA